MGMDLREARVGVFSMTSEGGFLSHIGPKQGMFLRIRLSVCISFDLHSTITLRTVRFALTTPSRV